jgi:hypothetical protein
MQTWMDDIGPGRDNLVVAEWVVNSLHGCPMCAPATLRVTNWQKRQTKQDTAKEEDLVMSVLKALVIYLFCFAINTGS